MLESKSSRPPREENTFNVNLDVLDLDKKIIIIITTVSGALHQVYIKRVKIN